MQRLSVVLIIIASVGCGPSGGDSAGPKPLFGIWTDASTGTTLDITGQTFDNGFYLHTRTPQGTYCTARYFVSGTESSGTVLADQIRADDGITHHTTNCHSHIGGGHTYTNNGAELVICFASNGLCSTYR